MARHVRHHCFRCRTVLADPRKDAFHAGIVLASSSVRSCRGIFLQVGVDSQARMLRESRKTSLSCAGVAHSDYGLATSVPGLSRHSRWASYHVGSRVWHQHRLSQTGLISDTPWCCSVADKNTLSRECAWRVVWTCFLMLSARTRSEPDLLSALSVHGAREQIMEEGWLGRPTVLGSYSWQAVLGMACCLHVALEVKCE